MIDKILEEHSKKLEIIDKILEEHSKKLEMIDKILEEHSKKLEMIDKILEEHSKKLEIIDKILEEHSKKLEIIIERLEIHEESLYTLRVSTLKIEDYVMNRIPALFDAHSFNKDKHHILESKVDVVKSTVDSHSVKISILEDTTKIHTEKLSQILP